VSAIRFVAFIFVAVSVASCGTYVPRIQEYGDDADGALLVHAIVRSIHCEIRNAVNSVIERDIAASRFNRQLFAKYLYGWGVQVGLTLQVEEKSSLNSTVLWTPPSPVSAIFNLAGSGTLSSDATRIDKLNYFYSVKDLRALGKCPADANAIQPHPPGSLLIQSDLGLDGWLQSQVMEAGTHEIGVPTTPNTTLKQNALSHEVKFEVVSTGSVTPGWKLTRVNINQTGTFLSATRDRTHDLTITFGPLDPSNKALSPTAQGIFLSSQFGLSVTNGLRSGILQ
jgi:hypothetical protein